MSKQDFMAYAEKRLRQKKEKERMAEKLSSSSPKSYDIDKVHRLLKRYKHRKVNF